MSETCFFRRVEATVCDGSFRSTINMPSSALGTHRFATDVSISMNFVNIVPAMSTMPRLESLDAPWRRVG